MEEIHRQFIESRALAARLQESVTKPEHDTTGDELLLNLYFFKVQNIEQLLANEQNRTCRALTNVNLADRAPQNVFRELSAELSTQQTLITQDLDWINQHSMGVLDGGTRSAQFVLSRFLRHTMWFLNRLRTRRLTVERYERVVSSAQ